MFFSLLLLANRSEITRRAIRTTETIGSCVSLPRCGEGSRVGGAARAMLAGSHH